MRWLLHVIDASRPVLIQWVPFICPAFAPVTKTPTSYSFTYAQCQSMKEAEEKMKKAKEKKQGTRKGEWWWGNPPEGSMASVA